MELNLKNAIQAHVSFCLSKKTQTNMSLDMNPFVFTILFYPNELENRYHFKLIAKSKESGTRLTQGITVTDEMLSGFDNTISYISNIIYRFVETAEKQPFGL